MSETLVTLIFSSGLNLRLLAAGIFKYLIQDVHMAGFRQKPREKPFKTSDDVGTVGLIAELVGRPCLFCNLRI